MFEFVSLGSSSQGNSYIIAANGETLYLEAAAVHSRVMKATPARCYPQGVLITHEHKDHAERFEDFLKMRLPVYASQGTINKMSIWLKNKALEYNLRAVKSGVQFAVGSQFLVTPFAVKHDAAEPLGYNIHVKGFGDVIFCLDCAELTDYTTEALKTAKIAILECNHVRGLVEANLSDQPTRLNRVKNNHLSVERLCEQLKGIKGEFTNLKCVMLAHLSDNNSDETQMQFMVSELLNSAKNPVQVVTLPKAGTRRYNF